MKAELSRDRVNGFLDTQGKKIVNQIGEEVILTGWGLGNWLLCEGYMWLSHGSSRFDRPRRIEAVIEELTGHEFAQHFWQGFREHFISEADIRCMADQGYNSVRIPINARLFLAEGPGLHWLDEGFQLLDQCIDWCEQNRLYAFIDLHGAPGGQTGANIDDSIDDVSRLFLDQDCFDKGVALWEKIARRYKDCWIVGGYDLLNEPLRPVRFQDDTDLSDMLPRLIEFYEKSIAAIRKIDTRHLITLEGHHWSTETDIFCKAYDPKMVIHFHRYGCLPDIASYQTWLDLSERWQAPLWLGETGESSPEWYTAMYPLAVELGIGYNLWPWKKMATVNSPCSIRVPEGWDELLAYTQGGRHPGYERAQKILTVFLEQIKLANCQMNDDLSSYIFRTPGCTVRATDFDERPGKGVSFSGLRQGENSFGYRLGTGMGIVEKFPDASTPYGFDSRWNRFVLELKEGEFACYTFHDVVEQAMLEIHCYSQCSSTVQVYQDDHLINNYALGKVNAAQVISGLGLRHADKSVIRLVVSSGVVEIDKLAVSR